MADDVLEQKIGGTFAEDLGVEIEYAEVEDVSPEQFHKYIENAAAELNPELLPREELTYEEEDDDTLGLAEYLSFLGNLADGQSRSLSGLACKMDDMVTKIDRIQKVMDKLIDAVTVLLDRPESEDSSLCDCEDVFEEVFEDLAPKKKGTPGRPAKEAPKTAIPPKKEKAKKPVVKKKPAAKPAPKPVAKPAAKKKPVVKKKAAKKKSKR